MKFAVPATMRLLAYYHSVIKEIFAEIDCAEKLRLVFGPQFLANVWLDAGRDGKEQPQKKKKILICFKITRVSHHQEVVS